MGSVIPKEIKCIHVFCTMVKYGETFYGRHTALTQDAVNTSKITTLFSFGILLLFLRPKSIFPKKKKKKKTRKMSSFVLSVELAQILVKLKLREKRVLISYEVKECQLSLNLTSDFTVR